MKMRQCGIWKKPGTGCNCTGISRRSGNAKSFGPHLFHTGFKVCPSFFDYNSTQELRMTLSSQAHSLYPVWSYHSNWSDIKPPSPPNSHQSQLGMSHLENTSPWTEVPLVVPEMPSPNIPNRETRPLGFG